MVVLEVGETVTAVVKDSVDAVGARIRVFKLVDGIM